jgi:hypothetical protein
MDFLTLVQYIHWKPEEAKERIGFLQAKGIDVRFEPFQSSTLKNIKKHPPDVVVIDLERLPSQGRDIGIALRVAKSTRFIPLVFVGGASKKVDRVKTSLPDAFYSSWQEIDTVIKDALQRPIRDPIVPESTLSGYSGTPLPKKLGIRENTVINLVSAPEGFIATLGELPNQVSIRKGLRKLRPQEHVITLWFVRSRSALRKRIRRMGIFAIGGGLWIIWPKKTSPLSTELSQSDVRQIGLDSGLVDFKICAVDEDWSGLRFSARDLKGA